jgi:hypothetical protein
MFSTHCKHRGTVGFAIAKGCSIRGNGGGTRGRLVVATANSKFDGKMGQLDFWPRRSHWKHGNLVVQILGFPKVLSAGDNDRLQRGKRFLQGGLDRGAYRDFSQWLAQKIASRRRIDQTKKSCINLYHFEWGLCQSNDSEEIGVRINRLDFKVDER